MGWLSDKLYGKRAELSEDKLRGYQSRTQGYVDEQAGIARGMMDPQSQMNQQMRNLIMRNAATGGAQIGQQMQKMSAMSGMSPAQAMMQARMGMNQSMGQSANQYQQQMQSRFGQGAGLLQQVGQQQQGLDENLAQGYISRVNAQNARRASRQGFTMDMFKTMLPEK
jgi:hypothetical protein